MPAAIGMVARRSADCSQRDDRPWPSPPRTRATLSRPRTASSSSTASGARVSATVVNPADDERRQRRLPGLEPRPGQREDRAHGDLDRAAVQRVGAARRQQDGVEAEGGARAEDRADVGVVDDVLQHQHRPGAGEDRVHRGQREPGERGQCAAVDVEAGDPLGERLGDHVAGRVRAREHVGEAVEPARRHQERPRREAGLDRAPDDLLPLGQEQPVLGLQVLAQRHVAQVAVVGEPRVVGVGDLDEVSHRPRRTAWDGRPGPPHRRR